MGKPENYKVNGSLKKPRTSSTEKITGEIDQKLVLQPAKKVTKPLKAGGNHLHLVNENRVRLFCFLYAGFPEQITRKRYPFF